jgi:hypothetical protein
LGAGVITSCSNKERFLKDYYQEYSFELPFKYIYKYATYDTFYFDTGLTIEQMCESINASGFKASFYNNDGIEKIFITAIKNSFSYYYVIYDKAYLESGNVYTLRECSVSLTMPIDDAVKEPYIYVFLFPHHLTDVKSDEQDKRKIYCSFDEFAEFYRATGKNDAQIDNKNLTVTFFCEGYASRNWIRGNLLMRYVESATGNYIHILPA